MQFHATIILGIDEQQANDVQQSQTSNQNTNQMIYFISLVGTDSNDRRGKGIPRKAISIFDVKSEMEFEDISGIIFLSAQDLLEYYNQITGKDGSHLNIYQLVIFFIERHRDDRFMLDEVPLIKDGKPNNVFQLKV